VAAAIESTEAPLRSAIDTWRASGGKIPEDVTLYALYQQRIYRLLSRHEVLARSTLSRLPSPLAAFARDVVTAHRELVRITPPVPLRAVRVRAAAAPERLLAYYRLAQRRFGVPWTVLAAVNFVESAFGKLRSASAAGAQGPMQFMSSTWRVYGLGGNVHDPHDAILGAANYLRASGARRDLRRALHAYNPSPFYVDAVLRYARRIRSDLHAFFELYSWQVYVRTSTGTRRVTGPGL
jgi:soluble lytic murein transglycosylase-like protein